MPKLEVTEEQLRVIQKALDFYSRVGTGDFKEIVSHPTFERHLEKEFSPKKELEVGDDTMRGEIVEIGEGYIKTKGHWGHREEVKTWDDPENLQHTPNFSKVHLTQDLAEEKLSEARNLLYNDPTFSKYGHWGIYHLSVDESCRVAFDLIQVIRHQRYLDRPEEDRGFGVDAYLHLTTKDSNKIKIEL